ncbi:alpha/beta fold hydrolase [Pontibacter mangrovi]|uniref:Alpha/beta hydrolase n=1 Tax=Pontibacter mangrovi TaxID=2589816 RepID=A0A501WA60_9BACT|nr:alpha/beta hydrolase [Pontibacter mangrovi]TPE46278.1 alpha/beta hydrolase [Pontibacter mangrovi]
MELLVANQSTRLYTVTYPNAGKETVILLHGGPGVPDGLEPVAELLHQNYQVITFHQRGTLSSPCYANKYTVERYLSDIDSIAERFKLEKFHLFGHSWGGLYAQLYAYQNPQRIRSLFLCSPASGTGGQWRETVAEVIAFNKRKSTGKEWYSMIKNGILGVLGSDSAYEKLFTQFCLNINKGYEVSNPVPVMVDHIVARAINKTNVALLKEPILEPMVDQGFKVTITYGEDDIFGDSMRYVKERYPYAQFETIPTSGHFPWLHNPEVFNETLKSHFSIAHASPDKVTSQ